MNEVMQRVLVFVAEISESAAASETGAVGGLLIAMNPSSMVLRKKKSPCTSLKVLKDFFRCSRTADVVILKYESTRFELVSQQKELET